MRPRLAVAALAIMLSARAALGQQTDDARAEAEGHWAKGKVLFAKEAYAAALAEFLESRRLAPSKSGTELAAYCLYKLQRFDEALEMYESLLRDFDGLSADVKRSAQLKVQELRGLVGTVEIAGAEVGAAISIDGRLRGEHPAVAPLRVAAGSHTVRLYKDGFEPFETRVDVAGGKTLIIQAALKALVASGELVVKEEAGLGLDVVVDGSVVGKTPWHGRVPLGEHVVLLRSAGELGTQPVTVTVRRDRTVPLTLVAQELTATARVEPTPSDAIVAIDGVTIGRGVWEGRLRAGAHTIELAEPGFTPVKRAVTIAALEHETVRITLERDDTSPFWAKPARRGRFIAEIATGLAIVPSIGGAASSCIGVCTEGVGVGGHGVVRGGYELGFGLGFGLALGWLTSLQIVERRATSLEVPGVPGGDQGTAADRLQLRGVIGAGWVGFTTSGTYPLHVRLEAGGLFGSAYDSRTGRFRATDRTPFALGPLTEKHDASFVVLTPDVRLGHRFTSHVELVAGLGVPVLIAVGKPAWTASHAANAGHDGYGTFAGDQLVGSVVVAIAPSVGARYDF